MPPAGLGEWCAAAADKKASFESPRLAPELESSLKRYGSYTELKRAALLVAAAQTDHRRADTLRKVFLELDTDASGTLDEGELCAALGVRELNSATKATFARLDHDSSGVVHYHEFLAATLEGQNLVTEEVLQDTFDRMDHDDSGVISRENLRALLGSRATDALVEKLMSEGDLKRNGHVDYEEFSAVMRAEDVAPMF